MKTRLFFMLTLLLLVGGFEKGLAQYDHDDRYRNDDQDERYDNRYQYDARNPYDSRNPYNYEAQRNGNYPQQGGGYDNGNYNNRYPNGYDPRYDPYGNYYSECDACHSRGYCTHRSAYDYPLDRNNPYDIRNRQGNNYAYNRPRVYIQPRVYVAPPPVYRWGVPPPPAYCPPRGGWGRHGWGRRW